MNVSLPETMRQWIDGLVRSGDFGTASEYVRALVREDQRRRAREELDAKLVRALDGGDESELTGEDWSRVRARLREHARDR